MKSRFLILVFIALLFLSCSKATRIKRTLDLSETIMDNHPDSALFLLNSMQIEDCPFPGQKARYAVLYRMAQDKNYIVETNDSIARIAYNYYRFRGYKDYRLKASYYLGVVHFNSNSFSEAIAEFLEAETLAKQLNNSHFLGLIYWRLTHLFSSNFDHVRSLEYAQKALDAYTDAQEPISVEYSWLDIANSLISNSRWQEAIPVLDSVMRRNSNHDALYSYCAQMHASVITLFDLHEEERAWRYYEEIIERNAIPLAVRDIGNMAVLCERMGKPQEADEYLNYQYSVLETVEDSAVFYNDKQVIYGLRNEQREADAALQLALKYQNKVVTRQLEHSVLYAMTAYYAGRASIERKRVMLQRTLFIMLIVLVVLVISWLLYLLHIRNQRLVQELASVQDVSKDLVEQRCMNDQISTIIDSFITDKVNTMQALSKAYFEWDYETVAKRDVFKGVDTREEVISRFRQQLGDLRNNQNIINALENYLNVSEYGIMIRAREIFGDNHNKYKLLILLLSGFSTKSISFLLRMSEPAIRKQKSRFVHFFSSLPEVEGRRYVELLSD